MMFPFCGLSASKATGPHQLAGFPYLPPSSACGTLLKIKRLPSSMTVDLTSINNSSAHAELSSIDMLQLPPSDGFLGGRDVIHQSSRIRFAGLFGAAYSNGSMTIEPVVLRPPMKLCAAAASRSGKVLTTLLATTPCATASNKDSAPASISLRFDM
jgi:hypothetical protein